MNKLAISFVTYNREKHIDEDLSVIAQPTKEYGIDIYIYDGSTDIRTEQVVKQYVDKGYDHIHYFHIGKHLSIVESIWQRSMAALLAPDAEYVWLCGDKFVIRPEYYAKILAYIDKMYDIITIYGYPLRGTRNFDKVDDLVDYAIIPITHWGSTIIKKKLVEHFDIREAFEKCPSFGIQLTYLRAIADTESFKGIVIDGGQRICVESRYKTRSRSLNDMWPGWVINWYRFIELLPTAYENIREGLYNRPDSQMGFFSLKELLRQRSEGQFDSKRYWECREYVKKVIVMPNIFVLGIAILPRRVAKCIETILGIIGKIYSFMKRCIAKTWHLIKQYIKSGLLNTPK